MNTIYVELTDIQAEALAQLCKRIGFDDLKSLSKDRDEAVDMEEAISRLRTALANVGFSPR